MAEFDELKDVPGWAVSLRVLVAEIKITTAQIPTIVHALEELRANTVPMHEHLKLMNDVEELQRRDLGERSEWEEMKTRVPVLWEERAEMRGSLRALKVAMAVGAAIVSILTVITLFRELGFSISLHT